MDEPAATPPPPEAVERTSHPLQVHLLLFMLTCITTTLAVGLFSFDPALPWVEAFARMLGQGAMYAGTLMAILLAHEMGHYVLARRHGVPVSLPYFLPGPPFISFGTFGAFIRMPQRVGEARALLDIGLAGPLAGLVVTIPFLALGLSLSPVEPLSSLRGGMFEGNSLLYLLLKWLILGPIPAGHDVNLHPIAFAGWMGLLVTSLNLFPVGQLDGGHIAFALLGPKRGTHIARVVFGSLLVLAVAMAIIEQLFVWVIWALLIALIGVRHPPLAPETKPLDRPRQVLGVLALLLFALTFTPIPISATPSGGWEEVPDDTQVSGMRSADPPLVVAARAAAGRRVRCREHQQAREATVAAAVADAWPGRAGGRASPAPRGSLPGVWNTSATDPF